MKTFEVQLSSIGDVKIFVNAACEQSFDIDVVSGRYVIDAKSIMGIFSVDLSKPIQVQVHGGAENEETFKKAIEAFLVS